MSTGKQWTEVWEEMKRMVPQDALTTAQVGEPETIKFILTKRIVYPVQTKFLVKRFYLDFQCCMIVSLVSIAVCGCRHALRNTPMIYEGLVL